MPQSRQLERFLHIDELLRQESRYTQGDLARACEVSQRQIREDLNFLRDRYDAPLVYNRKQGWHYTDLTWRLPSISLSQGELLALMTASQTLSGYGGVYQKELRSALDQLGKRLPEQSRIDLQQLAHERMIFAPGASLSLDPEIWCTAVTATQTSRRLWMRYFTASRRRETEREFDPYVIHISRVNTIYLIGYCHWRQEIRSFRLDRIREIRLLDTPFERDPTFDAREYLSQIFQAEVGDNPCEVVIDFDAQTTPFVKERQWHSSQEIELHSDGSMTLRLTVTGLNEIKRWLLGYGSGAIARHPPELVKMLQDETDVMARQYETGGFE